MSKIWRFKLTLSLCILALAAGCGDDPAPMASTGDGDQGDGDGDKGDGDGDEGDGDGGDGDGDVDPGKPLSGIAGKYWMRTDLKANMMVLTSTLASDLTAYSLVEITEDGDDYQMVDWQCHVTTKQSCTAPCSEASSETDEGESYAPAVRKLTVNGNKWQASECAQAVGWKWNFAEDGDRDLPVTGDPLIYSPGGGGPGVDITAQVTTIFGGEPLKCVASTVQTVDVLYSGTLSSDGKNLQDTGTAKDNGSSQQVIDDANGQRNCGDVPAPEPVGTGTLRLVEKDFAGAKPSDWTCPSLSEFQAALPKK